MIFKKVGFYIILATCLSFFISVMINILPENPLTKNKENIFQKLAPQGFEFYSKSPRDDSFFIEEASPDSRKIQLPASSPSNLFGLKRTGRAQGVEIGTIIEQVPDDEWVSCHSFEECDEVKSDLSVYMMDESESFDFMQGTYFIILGEPISWYWTDFKETLTFDRKISKVGIK